MPHYTFELRDGTDLLEDEIGVSLAHRDDALEYARGVARELMSGREVRARTWQLDVYENRRHRIFEIPFVALDATLNHLDSDLRATIETVCRRQLALREVLSAVQATLRESRHWSRARAEGLIWPLVLGNARSGISGSIFIRPGRQAATGD